MSRYLLPVPGLCLTRPEAGVYCVSVLLNARYGRPYCGAGLHPRARASAHGFPPSCCRNAYNLHAPGTLSFVDACESPSARPAGGIGPESLCAVVFLGVLRWRSAETGRDPSWRLQHRERAQQTGRFTAHSRLLGFCLKRGVAAMRKAAGQ